MHKPLSTGATIGILGGGQLGRMLSVAAARLGFRSHIFEPNPDCPASHVADRLTTASYTDTKALQRFAETVDVITYEFENIPTSALDVLEQVAMIRPGREALRISQDRLTEKDFLNGLGLKTAPYASINDASALRAASLHPLLVVCQRAFNVLLADAHEQSCGFEANANEHIAPQHPHLHTKHDLLL